MALRNSRAARKVSMAGRPDTRAIVLEVEFQGVLARCEWLLPLPPNFLDREEIIGEDRLALEQIEPVAAEAATVTITPSPPPEECLSACLNRRNRLLMGECGAAAHLYLYGTLKQRIAPATSLWPNLRAHAAAACRAIL
jgi:hypothetical protein